MRSFKQHMVITEATKGPTGAEYESIIAVGYNQGTPPYSSSKAKDSGAFSTAKKFLPKNKKQPYNDTAYKLGQAMKTATSGPTMTQAGGGKADLTPFWTKITGKGVDTSKTDVITKDNISLKKKGGSQLMSASKKESMATLTAALEMIGENAQISKIIDTIDKKFTKFMGKSVTGFKKKEGEFAKLSSADYKEKADKLLEIDIIHKDLSDSLSNALDGEKTNIKEAITYIATTGYKKFPKGSVAIANRLIEFDPVKGIITHNIKTGTPGNMSGQMKSMAAATSFYVNFKTSKINPYSALRTRTGKFEEHNPTLNGLIIETLMKDLNVDTQSLLNEGYAFFTEEKIIEGLFDKAFSSLKKLGKSIKNWFSNIVSKIVEGAQKVFKRVKGLGQKAFEVLFDFLGVEMSNANVRISGIAGGFANK